MFFFSSVFLVRPCVAPSRACSLRSLQASAFFFAGLLARGLFLCFVSLFVVFLVMSLFLASCGLFAALVGLWLCSLFLPALSVLVFSGGLPSVLRGLVRAGALVRSLAAFLFLVSFVAPGRLFFSLFVPALCACFGCFLRLRCPCFKCPRFARFSSASFPWLVAVCFYLLFRLVLAILLLIFYFLSLVLLLVFEVSNEM